MHNRFRAFLLVCALGLIGPRLRAHEPLTEEMVQALQASNDYDDAMMRARAWEHYRCNSGVAQKALYQLRKAQLEAQGLSSKEISERIFGDREMAFPYSAYADLPSTGMVRTVTILVDFSDCRAANLYPQLPISSFQENIYGEGTGAAQAYYPYESVSSYYKRASDRKVDLRGNVLGWYHFPNKRDSYRPNIEGLSNDQKLRVENAAIFRMVKEALRALDATHDFSQYDNDNDGDIDTINILYAGPPGPWNSFWWAYRWKFFPTTEVNQTMFDGKLLNQFVFQFISTREGGSDFNPATLMHETGHAFGLPDYYDYKPAIGPPGGLGGLDMMDSNWGNHNAFSRFLLDWTKPEVIGAGLPHEISLVASGSTLAGPRSVAIFPGLVDMEAPGQEMFILENRFRIGNDSGSARMPNDGLLIWHVHGQPNLNGDGFQFDNSYTDHKLIQLLRADSASDFATNGRAGSGTYFTAGRSLTPLSSPNSNGFDGQATGISVTDISASAEIMTLKVGFVPNPPASTDVLAFRQPQAVAAADRQAARSSQAAPPTTNTVNLEEMEKLLAEFSVATPQKLKEAWQAANQPDAVGSGNERQSLVLKRLILAQWAAKSGDDAMGALLAAKDQKLLAACYSPTLEAWADHQPQAAANWYFKERTSPGTGRSQLAVSPAIAQTIFRHAAFLGLEDAVTKIDRLKSSPEILGAMKGIDEVVTISGADTAARVEAAVGKLKTNGQAAKAIRNYILADTALQREIKGDGDRALIRALVHPPTTDPF